MPDLERARDQWGWLLGRLGYEAYQDWAHGCSWRRGPTYIDVEQSPALTGNVHDRTAPGRNHLAFSAGTRDQVDAMAAEGLNLGWTELFPDKYPHAGGPGHFAAYLVNTDGYQVELIAAD